MAIGTISFEQEPIGDSSQLPVITNWTPIVPYTVKQTSITDLFYFKFILEVRLTDASGTLLGKIKQRPNGYATGTTNVIGIYDVKDIVNSQLEDTIADQNDTTKSIHTLGKNVATKIYSTNSNQLRTVYVKAYQEFSSAANASPSENTSSTVNDTKFYIAASLPLETARGTDDFQATAFIDYQSSSLKRFFLTDIPLQRTAGTAMSGLAGEKYINRVQGDDYHTIAFLNGEDDFDNDVNDIKVHYYNTSGILFGTAELDNISGNGGADPTTGGTLTDAQRLLYFGVGPQNLEEQSIEADAKPSNNAGWAYYYVRARKGSSTISTFHYFLKQDASCKGFKIRRLAWRNSLGAWDYFNFTKKSTQTVEVKRNKYESMLGDFNSSMYSYDNFSGGKKVRQTTAILKETLETDWLEEPMSEFLENAIKSTNVQIIENADTSYTVPVLITDTSFVRKTVANDGVKIRYTFKIEYANPLNTNS